MKKSQLKKIIKEELKKVLKENFIDNITNESSITDVIQFITLLIGGVIDGREEDEEAIELSNDLEKIQDWLENHKQEMLR